MRDPDRWRPVFMLVWMTVTLGGLGLLVAWARETERYWILWGLSLLLAFLIGRLWNYREPD